MKNLNKILLAATFTAAVGLAIQASAADNGIAASPKAQQTLNERSALANTACCMSTSTVCSATKTTKCSATACCMTTTSTTAASQDGIAASPKARVAIDERNAAANSSSALAENTAAEDGIAASPKVRQQLNERVATFTVAPLK